MKTYFFALILLACASLCWGQESAPVADRTYWTAAGVAVAATTADTITTALMVGRGKHCATEGGSPYLYGARPTAPRMVTAMAGGVFAAALASHQLRKHTHGTLHRLWFAPLAVITVVHVDGTINNLEVCR